MDDKRRRARVQSTWSQIVRVPAVPIRQPSLAGLASASNTTSATPTVDGINQCLYQATNQEIRQRPPDIMIERAGRHVLSTAPEGGECSIILYPAFLSNVKECDDIFQKLYSEVDWQEKRGAIRGESFRMPRLLAWYGPLPYRYAGVTMPTQLEWCETVRYLHDQITARTGHRFNSVLLNLYRDGRDSVAWHSDGELLMGVDPTIASLSLGETRMFEMRHKTVLEGVWTDADFETSQHVKIPLQAGTLLIMEGKTQTHWQHRIPKEFHDRKARINLTFRTVFLKQDGQ